MLAQVRWRPRQSVYRMSSKRTPLCVNAISVLGQQRNRPGLRGTSALPSGADLTTRGNILSRTGVVFSRLARHRIDQGRLHAGSAAFNAEFNIAQRADCDEATPSHPSLAGIELNVSEAKPTLGCCGGYLESLVRTLASGGTEIGIFAAYSRGVPSIEAKAIRVPIVTRWWGDDHRPVPLIIGSAKLHVMLGRCGRLNRQS
jgi:hypothetical protein